MNTLPILIPKGLPQARTPREIGDPAPFGPPAPKATAQDGSRDTISPSPDTRGRLDPRLGQDDALSPLAGSRTAFFRREGSGVIQSRVVPAGSTPLPIGHHPIDTNPSLDVYEGHYHTSGVTRGGSC